MSISITEESAIKMFNGGINHLYSNVTTVNELNVFPVPDGDTGDNMYSTLYGGASRIPKESVSLGEALKKISGGMLLGARGNSGVILSRIGAGIARGFDGCSTGSADDLVHATEAAINESYNSVSHPVEGTILTVFKDAARYANAKINDKSTIESYLDDFIYQAKISVDNTPNQLQVLKEAGVVDSGGAGVVYIAEGMKLALNNDSMDSVSASEKLGSSENIDYTLFNENSVLEYGYCTEFLLQLQRSKIDIDSLDKSAFSDYLTSHGDSVVCFFEGSIFKAHVHTMRPGEILNHFQQYGEFIKLKIENMTIQHKETEIKNSYTPKKAKATYGIVSVACGEGVKQFFLDLGSDIVISGGQSMNPSVEDFIKAYESLDCEKIFVLPNNPNVFLSAKQSAEIYRNAQVIVIGSKNIGDGYVALSQIDINNKNYEEIVQNAECAMEECMTYSISTASRDTVSDGIAIKKGQYIGFSEKKILNCFDKRTDAAADLIKNIIGESDVMMIVFGQSVEPKEANELISSLEKEMSRTEFVLIDGKQPIYDYIIIKE